MMVERCKKKHWWNRDPHDWKYYNYDLRDCKRCGLMQDLHAIEGGWQDITRKRFEEWIQFNNEQKVKEKETMENIEKDRLKTVAKYPRQ